MLTVKCLNGSPIPIPSMIRIFTNTTQIHTAILKCEAMNQNRNASIWFAFWGAFHRELNWPFLWKWQSILTSRFRGHWPWICTFSDLDENQIIHLECTATLLSLNQCLARERGFMLWNNIGWILQTHGVFLRITYTISMIPHYNSINPSLTLLLIAY